MAERSFVSGQKIILSHTHKRVSYHGQKRVLPVLVDGKEICHGQKIVLICTEKSLVLDRENLVMAVVGHRDCSRSNL